MTQRTEALQGGHASESTSEEIMKDVIISEEDLRKEFAVLRHMEVLGAAKKEGKIFYTMFNKNHG